MRGRKWKTYQSPTPRPPPGLLAFCPAAAEAKLEGRLVGMVDVADGDYGAVKNRCGENTVEFGGFVQKECWLVAARVLAKRNWLASKVLEREGVKRMMDSVVGDALREVCWGEC